MKFPALPFLAVFCLAVGGCLTAAPRSQTSGFVVKNSSVPAITGAAQSVFSESGFTVSSVSYPDSITFDKPAGAWGNLLYGSAGVKPSTRAKLTMTPIPGTKNYRLSVSLKRVDNAGEAGFEEDQKMLGMWSSQFNPLLRKIVEQASGVGGGGVL